MLPEERERMQQQVVEVHRVGRPQRRAHGRVHVGGHLGEAVEGRSRGELRGDTIRFLAAEMIDCTARGGNSFAEWPRWSISRLTRLSRSSSS